jgi:3-hydroxymyristoyl/3-hydroxydecanoyl-(acyl carrier protein) dehydratase
VAQAAGILAFRAAGVVPDDTRFYFVGIDKARSPPVEPGDQVILTATSSRDPRDLGFDVRRGR